MKGRMIMELAYTMQGDYLIPGLVLPEEEMHIGKYGMLRRTYLKNHRKGTYAGLMMSGKLNSHLIEIDRIAKERIEMITAKLGHADIYMTGEYTHIDDETKRKTAMTVNSIFENTVEMSLC